MQLEDELKAKEGKQLWIYEYPSLDRPIISSAKEVSLYVTRVIRSLSHEGLNELWANEGKNPFNFIYCIALTWAISCPSGHLITRSYQIYRAVNPPIHRDAIIDVLRALSRLIQNPTSDSMGVVLEILYTLKVCSHSSHLTLQVMALGIALPKLILFTQFFWAIVALLNTDYEQVYADILSPKT